jgi:hypothetical protein
MEAHSWVHPQDGLAWQLWYSDRSSIVAARTRCTSVLLRRRKEAHNRQATERVKSAILNHEPAIAATNAAQFTPTHAGAISRVTMKRTNERKKIQSWERLVKATPARRRAHRAPPGSSAFPVRLASLIAKPSGDRSAGGCSSTAM